MDDLLEQLINRYFNSVKAQDLFRANDLLITNNYTDHLEHFHDFLGTEAIDNPDTVATRILEIFEQSLYDVLLTMFIVPAVTEFNPLLSLLENVYKLETYLDHEVILNEIDDMVYLNSPKETLIHLIEEILDGDWAELNDTIQEVRQTLIDSITLKHKNAVSVRTVDSPENLLVSRIKETEHFFNTHPDTIVQGFVRQGILPVPVEVDNSIPTVIDTLYNLEDNRQIAVEILALAFIAPIHLNSISIQCRTLINLLYLDVETVTQLNLEVDKLIREGGLTHAQPRILH